MILPEHIHCFDKLRQFYLGPMLLLGDQQYVVPYDFGVTVKTLDIMGEPDILHDLTKNVFHLGLYTTVFNLGTLEHIWDVETAWTHALQLSSEYFITCSPVAGWEGHCCHITNWLDITTFLIKANFNLVYHFFTTKEGEICSSPSRNCGKSILYWAAYKK